MIEIISLPGKTLVARLYQQATQVGGNIALTEAALPGDRALYSAAIPNVGEGEYRIDFFEGDVWLAADTLLWTGAEEANLLNSGGGGAGGGSATTEKQDEILAFLQDQILTFLRADEIVGVASYRRLHEDTKQALISKSVQRLPSGEIRLNKTI